jgi:hypothetical protein
LVKKLQGTPGPVALVGRAKTLREIEGGTLTHAVADAVVRLYNANRRSRRIPDWRAE